MYIIYWGFSLRFFALHSIRQILCRYFVDGLLYVDQRGDFFMMRQILCVRQKIKNLQDDVRRKSTGEQDHSNAEQSVVPLDVPFKKADFVLL